ncbi:hypothetical protein ABFA07_005302 [Porites harrisoni]
MSSRTYKVYVGNLGSNGSKRELEMEFERFGRLHDVWVARNPPGFAFVEFVDLHDAEDAIKSLDGARICGERVRVEMARTNNSRGGGGGEVEVIALVAVMIEAVGGVMTEDLAEVTMTDLDLPTGHHHAEEADLWRETGGEVEEEEAGLVAQGDSNFPER